MSIDIFTKLCRIDFVKEFKRGCKTKKNFIVFSVINPRNFFLHKKCQKNKNFLTTIN